MRSMSEIRRGPRLAVLLTVLALSVSACGGGSQSASDAEAPAVGSGAQEATQVYEAAPREASGRDTAPRNAPQKTAQVKVVPQDRAIVYTAEMTVRAKDVTAAADRARQIVTAAGGYLAMERSDAHSDGEGSATLVFKIPPGNYPGALDRLGKDLGTRESLRQNTEDVTEQVADVESRLKSARAALDSLRTLLKRANTIGEVLEVEREVSNRESELESLQARQKTLASQTSVATLTLNLVGPATVVSREEDEPSGFLGGLRAGWSAFVTAVKIGLTLLGVLLPWLVLIGLLWLAVAFLRRSRRTGRGDRPLGPAPAAPEPDRSDGDSEGTGDTGDAGDAGDAGDSEGAGHVPLSSGREGTPG